MSAQIKITLASQFGDGSQVETADLTIGDEAKVRRHFPGTPFEAPRTADIHLLTFASNPEIDLVVTAVAAGALTPAQEAEIFQQEISELRKHVGLLIGLVYSLQADPAYLSDTFDDFNVYAPGLLQSLFNQADLPYPATVKGASEAMARWKGAKERRGNRSFFSEGVFPQADTSAVDAAEEFRLALASAFGFDPGSFPQIGLSAVSPDAEKHEAASEGAWLEQRAAASARRARSWPEERQAQVQQAALDLGLGTDDVEAILADVKGQLYSQFGLGYLALGDEQLEQAVAGIVTSRLAEHGIEVAPQEEGACC